jgi:hypothetical protein
MQCPLHRLSRLLLCSLAMATTTPAHAHDPVAEMVVSAERLLDALDEAQRSQAVFKMSDEERENWHFLPDKYIKPVGIRRGLPLKQMTSEQRPLAHSLLSTGLSHDGYLTAMTITSLEQILHDLEQGNSIRHPELYYMTIFGEPGDPHTWGWRFEGHHLSVNFAIVEGKLVSVTPAFFGANPAIVKLGSRKGLWTLRDEEQLGRHLVTSLSEKQRKAAILNDSAPDDIITGEQRKVDKGRFVPAEGISCDDLNEEQKQILLKLIKAFAQKFRPEIVNQIDESSNLFELDDVHFVWAGGMEQGEGHYYRVQTPKFLFEYDNTQNNANHVHAVWRDFEGDFGADLLRKHYKNHHVKQLEP